MKQDKQALDKGQIRQGDVLLVRVAESPEVKASETNVVIAHGEVTGHKHQFMAESRVSYLGRDSGLERFGVGAPSVLLHEEHSAPTVPPGLYDRPIQTEWSDDLEPRQVAD